MPGVEVAGPGWYARTLDLPHGPGTVRLVLADAPVAGETAFVTARFVLHDLRDTTAAVERARRLVDADCDPLAVDDQFAGDPVVGPLVRATPGLRVPGQVDGDETAIRTVIGQQVSVVGACTVAGRVVAEHGRPVDTDIPGLTHLFPDAVTLAAVDPATLPMPKARGRALVGLAASLASGAVALDRGPDRDEVRRALVELPGIGPWTADYVAMRALGHPDVFLPTDLGVRNALVGLGHDPGEVVADSDRWRPWRSYALMHLWNTLMPATPPAGNLARTRRTDMWTVMDSPIGELRLVERDGEVTQIEFSPFRDGDGRPRGGRDDAHPVLVETARQLAAYFAGDRTDFDLPVAPVGSDFQQRVWKELQTIGYGETASYGEIALRLGMTNAASRAVGLANGRNPIPIVIPCHRVIGANGTLTGYAGGLERKQLLLELEQLALF